ERRVMRAENRESEGDEAVAIGEGAGKQPLDLAAWMRDFGEVRLAGLGLGLRRAMKEGRSDAALDQPAYRGVGMVRRRIVVTPVDQGGRAVVDLVQRADKRCDIDVLGSEDGRQTC